jgi:opacity protein-like surface antigen
MIRSFSKFLLLASLTSTSLVWGQASQVGLDTRRDRLADLLARVSIHEAQVTRLLSKDPVPRTNFDLPPPAANITSASSTLLPAPPPAPVRPATLAPSVLPPEAPYVPPPQFDDPVTGETVREVPAPPSLDDLVADPNQIKVSSSDGNSSEKGEDDLDEAYAKLYDSDTPSRHKGYYFGPLLGFIFPDDIATRTPNGLIPGGYDTTPYESDSGYLIGLQAGKDFGSIRLEGEYAYHSFDASAGMQATVHTFFSRIILEKEIGERFDIRTGLGMGVGLVSLEKGVEFSGVGFAYDFLLGVAYRVGENWGLQCDYRYFLTAANDEYDRMNSHVWLFSASVDL